MTSRSAPYTRKDEDSGERLDRHWNELLQELRLAQTGTQILFAFLLSIGFQAQFQAADQFTHDVYAATLIASALAVALFLAPVSFHRVVHRQGLRHRLVTMTNWLAQAGLGLLVVAMAGGVLLALDVVLSRPLALGIVGGILLWFVTFWWVIPLAVRSTSDEEPVGRSDDA